MAFHLDQIETSNLFLNYFPYQHSPHSISPLNSTDTFLYKHLNDNNDLSHIDTQSNISSSKYNTTTNNNNNNNKRMTRAQRLKNNRESAQRSRKRKKELQTRMYKENIELRRQLTSLKEKLHNRLCPECKLKLNLTSLSSSSSQQQQHQTSSTNSTPIITTQTINKFISKPFVLFTTFTVVLCIYNFFNGDNTSNNYSAITNMTYNGMFNSYYQSNKIRHLNHKTVEISSTEIERLNLTMGGMFISFGDYYTLMNYKGKETFLNRDKMYSFKNLGKVMLINENDLTNQNVRNGCMNNKCIVEITSDNVQIKEGSPMLIKLLFNTNIYEKSNNNNNNNNNDNYQQNTSTFLYEIDCQAIGFRKHLLNDTFKNIPTIHT